MNSQQRRKQRRKFCYRIRMPWHPATRYRWELHDWLTRNIGDHKYVSNFRNNAYEFGFDSESNAMLFAFRWCGE